jgi:erythronate-4-phosphate dehydrogenase
MLIIADENIPLARDAFAGLGDVRLVPGRAIDSNLVRDADVLLVRSVTRVDEGLLRGSRIRMLATATAGSDHVDVDYLESAGIAFADAPGSNAEPVVEYVLATMFLHARDTGRALHEFTVGIVGCGNVGGRLADRLGALGVRCLINDPPLAERIGRQGLVSLELALSADIVTLHVPLVETGRHPTRHILTAERLSRLKPGALFINASRGEVVNQAALATLAGKRADLSLALDVWADEPRIDQDLVDRAFIATPHIAGYSYDAKLRGTLAVYRACCRFLGTECVWNYHDSLPPARDFTLNAGSKSDDAALLETMLAVYDPRTDDARLRESFTLPANERGAAFDALRKNYPLRREFDSLRILARDAGTSMRVKLESLGFQLAAV